MAHSGRLLRRVLALGFAVLAFASACGTPGGSTGPGPIQTPAGVSPRVEPITSRVP